MPTDHQLETETIIRWDRTGDPATLWTADRSVANKWRQRGYPVRDEGKPGRESWRCEVPVRCIRFGPFVPRVLSEAERAARVASAQAIQARRARSLSSSDDRHDVAR